MFTQPPSKSSQTDIFVEEGMETPSWENGAARTLPAAPARFIIRVRDHDWTVGLFLAFCDIICWALLYGLVGYIRRDAFFATPFEFVLVDCISLLVLLQALYIVGGYSRNTETRSLTYTAEHILAVAAAAVISSLLIYSSAAYDAAMKPSRGVLLISFILFAPLSMLYRRLLRRTIVASAAQRAFLVIGSGELARQFYLAYTQSPNQQQLEFVDNDTARVGSTIAGEGSPLIQGGIAAKLAAPDRRYSGVILAESVDRLGQDLIERLVRTQFQRTRVYTLESFYEAHWRHVPMHTIDPFWPLQMGFQLARISPYHYLKRLFDVIASALLLVISSPLIVIVWCLIRLTSKGPAIFGQSRVGREGQRFTAYKFRTMRAASAAAWSEERGLRLGRAYDSERATSDRDQSPSSDLQAPGVGGSQGAKGEEIAKGEMRSAKGEQEGDDKGHGAEVTRHTSQVTEEDIYTREDDPRVTGVGRWLRRLRLDELPQLWNVLKGDMSLIGPRAEWEKCVERYENRIPFYHFRHLVKPGITGWAQVNYPYGESEEDAINKLQYDLYYIRHYSLKLDAMIVLKTIHTMLFGRGR